MVALIQRVVLSRVRGFLDGPYVRLTRLSATVAPKKCDDTWRMLETDVKLSPRRIGDRQAKWLMLGLGAKSLPSLFSSETTWRQHPRGSTHCSTKATKGDGLDQ